MGTHNFDIFANMIKWSNQFFLDVLEFFVQFLKPFNTLCLIYAGPSVLRLHCINANI